MDIETAKNAQSLMDRLRYEEDKLKLINQVKESIQMTKGMMDGHIIIRDIGYQADVKLDVKEIFDVFDFLSAYWTMEKYNTMKEIEEL